MSPSLDQFVLSPFVLYGIALYGTAVAVLVSWRLSQRTRRSRSRDVG